MTKIDPIQNTTAKDNKKGATMTRHWIHASYIFDGQNLLADHAICVENGHVCALVPTKDAPQVTQRIDATLSFGFIDLQVNGGGNILLNTAKTPDDIRTIAAAHRQFGTIGILPTVITDAPEVLERVTDLFTSTPLSDGILGIHIEGPHISQSRRGTHAARFVRDLTDQDPTWAQIQRLRDADIPVMITLAPEACSSHHISRLSDMGVVVSIGHSDADAELTGQAIDAGVECATHLFNAMSPMLNRAPGMTGTVINSEIYAGLIADGIHVSDAMIALALRARPVADRTFLVSDAMPTVGGSDQFTLYDMDVTLSNGQLVNPEGSLAGAHITQAQGLHRLITAIGIAPETALRMVTNIPARAMKHPEWAELIGQPVENIVTLDKDWVFQGFLSV